MRALFQNLLAGFRLAIFLKVHSTDFRVSIRQLVWLLLIEFALGVGISYAMLEGAGSFNVYVVVQALASVTLTLAVAALLAAWLRAPALLLGYAVAATAMAPMLLAYTYGGYALWQRLDIDLDDSVWTIVWLLLVSGLLARVVKLWAPLKFFRLAAVEFLLLGVLIIQLWLPQQDAWYADDTGEDDSVLDIGGHEALLYQQPRLLDGTLHTLQAQRPDVSDLYFVGFAGYGWQDVFMKEMNTVRELFDSRFDTRGRSLALINNTKTGASAPIATTTALQTALAHVGGLLDPEEDVLFLFVTSHGSDKPAYLSVDNNDLKLTQLTPARLKAALAATPIKWKVIVVSACYSGSFIPALKDDNTLVITASRADRNSFGCDAKNSMTDFGRAYFAEALKQTTSFTAAFKLASQRIAVREKAEGLTPSQPQMSLGKNFEAKWRGRLDCGSATSPTSETKSVGLNKREHPAGCSRWQS
ncbi:C13 family peptidase [Thiobacillus sp.]|uniref:C13 family peptidase n=1 Tax=Thiobacillus sp. TaxID=924 RepID=UPI00286DE23B|nr:C13 family peptidase [Thiobacillus sp.]